ncbi:GntR family transcriptional regulator [Arthrobacter sp. M4]|uniref:GntR family transcriptional regulator n=1 Tax=Arthrobacter sp. M4 TaxID=218160 RepID=UPI001CDB8BE3|nr:GntR family transcriptional regulator [Arthrobacter sp. M4]MCA4134838.1 GntR family transcriptional regulator [Arthrobacter sp. M4]
MSDQQADIVLTSLLPGDAQVSIDPVGVPIGPLGPEVCNGARRAQRPDSSRNENPDATAAPDQAWLARVLHLKRSGPEPLYYQLACSVEAAIAAGTILSGTRLPPERDIAHELCLATGTIRQAWSYLEGRGVIKRARKTGTFIA